MPVKLRNSKHFLFYICIALVAIVFTADTASAQLLTVTPTSLSFATAPGTSQSQTISVSTSSGSVPFTVSATSAVGWLAVTTTGGTATTSPTTITALFPGVNLPIGVYTGTITITPLGGAPIQIPATLNLGGSATFSASPSTLSFNSAVGGSAINQAVSLTSSSSSALYSVTSTVNSGIGWLQVSPTSVNVGSGTAGSITVTVLPSGLQAGTYNGSINVLPQGSGSAIVSIPVTLKVGAPAAGTLLANPSQLTVNFLPGSGQPSSQNVQISSSSNNLQAATAVATVSSGSGWLSVSPTSFTISSLIPVNLSVVVNPAGLSSGVTYTGSVQVTAADGSTVTVNVLASSSGTTGLSANPSPLNISVPAGSTTPVTQNLSVNLSSGSTTFSAQVTGLNWLTVSPVSANISAGTPVTVAVTANPPAGISSGVYGGTILLTPQSGTQISVGVNVTVGSSGSYTLSPASLNFVDQLGGAFPAAQTVMITGTSNQQIPFTVSVSTNSGGTWLVVAPQNGSIAPAGSTPTSLSVQVNPSFLAIGSYSGTISVTSFGSPSVTQSIPVTLLVTDKPLLLASNANPGFTYQFGSATQPAQQQIQLTSSSSSSPNLPFTAVVTPGTGGNWLQLSGGSGTTPASLSLSVNPSVLAALAASSSPYTANVTVTSGSAANSPLNIPVTLLVSGNGASSLTVSQSSLAFVYQTQHPQPAAQVLAIGSNNGTNLAYTVTVATASCGNFLSATPTSGNTPGTITATVNTAGLAAGTCSGTITLTPPQGSGSAITVPVTLQVSDTALLYVSPSAVNVVGSSGAIQNQTLSVTSTDPATTLGFNVTSNTTNGGGWLLIGPTSGSTPINLTVGFQITGLPVGIYSGSVTITPTGSNQGPVIVPITLTIQSTNTATASPSSLTFSQSGGPNPSPQTVSINGGSGLTFTTSASTTSGGTWLSVSPSSGVSPGTITVSVNPANLTPQAQPYTGTVTVSIPGASNSPLTIPVSFLVTTQSFGVSPSQLTFTYQPTLGTPAPQGLQINSASSLPFSASVTGNPSGLFVLSATSGNTPATLSVSLNPTILGSLAASTYSGSVTISVQGTSISQTIPLSVVVQAPPTPILNALVNSANAQVGSVSPGELVTLYGTNIGPANASGLQLVSGLVSTNLSNTVVTFDGIPAPLIYVSSGQINAIVPYEVNGRFITSVVVQRSGIQSNTLQYTVAQTNPAIFSTNQSGTGPGSILNFNNTFNSATTPAARGSVVQIFATGEGALIPQPITGSVTSSTGPIFPKPSALVSITIGGQPAQIVYAGEAPGLVSGVLQVNAVIPNNIGSGPQQIVLTLGTASNSQQNITVAVQ